ncbi:unnamed protein product [Heligmosomoides polygyrus]|uniref:Transmembrane protein n=1 Tax=Heligmosomoides polygyrus TaxID=6339 RepID=A0A183GE04_HELPZ|nr:unnamed protein product [Heligmosomoides polygyrus]
MTVSNWRSTVKYKSFGSSGVVDYVMTATPQGFLEYYNIDGRFDLRQLMREPEHTVKIQYSIALFTPSVLSILLFVCVHHQYGAIKFFWALTCITQIVLAYGLASLEAYEVLVKGN